MVETLRNAAGEAIDPARDRPGLAIRTLLGATFAGTAAVSLVLWTVRRLLAGAAASDQPVIDGPAVFVLIMGSCSAIILAAAISWFRLSRLSSTSPLVSTYMASPGSPNWKIVSSALNSTISTRSARSARSSSSSRENKGTSASTDAVVDIPASPSPAARVPCKLGLDLGAEPSIVPVRQPNQTEP